MGLSNEYITQAIQKNFTNQNTAKTYIGKISKLSKMLNKTIYDILKNPETSMINIKTLYPTSLYSQINIVTMIITIFKTIPELTIKKSKTASEWRSQYEKLKILIPDKIDHTQITKEEIDAKYEEMKSKEHLRKTSDFLLLSMIKHLKVPKADFSKIYVVRPPTRQSSATNYIVLNEKPYLVLNKVRYFLPEELVKDIKQRQSEYLFGPYEKTNSYNVFFIRAFQNMFGKKIGVNGVKQIHINKNHNV